MVYTLTLKQQAFILSSFFGGFSIRRLTVEFRTLFYIPISSSTIYRLISNTIPRVDHVISYLLTLGKVYTVRAGDVWEADGTYTKGVKICLIPVRDLKTGFILGSVQSRTEDEVSIENALREAKEVAHKCPKIFRCDGNPAYVKAAKKVFRNKTKVEVYKRVGRMGQNQAIEGYFSAFKDRLKSMHGMHSEARSRILLRGLVIDHNFVRSIDDFKHRTPAEMVGINIGSLFGDKWLTLLELTKHYEKELKKQDYPYKIKKETGHQTSLGPFLDRKALSTGLNPRNDRCGRAML